MLQRHVRAMLFALALMGAMATAGASQASSGISFSATTIGASGTQTFNGMTTCDVLLSITLNSRTLPKNTGTTQGSVSGGYIRNCSGQAGSPNTGQILGPVAIPYQSFSGTLPSITTVRLLAPSYNFGINLPIAGFCLYEGSNAIDFNSRTSVVPDRTAIPKASGSFLCPSTGTLTGPLTTWLPSAPTITLV